MCLYIIPELPKCYTRANAKCGALYNTPDGASWSGGKMECSETVEALEEISRLAS